jgi:hypothetical protein
MQLACFLASCLLQLVSRWLLVTGLMAVVIPLLAENGCNVETVYDTTTVSPNLCFEIVVAEAIGDVTTDIRLRSGHFRVSAFSSEQKSFKNFLIARQREPKPRLGCCTRTHGNP